MAWISRWRGPRSRATLLVMLLVATLALTAVLAREAHRASVSHREVAQRVLQDYVEFAGWEFARAARHEMGVLFEQGLTSSERALPAPLPAVLSREQPMPEARAASTPARETPSLRTVSSPSGPGTSSAPAATSPPRSIASQASPALVRATAVAAPADVHEDTTCPLRGGVLTAFRLDSESGRLVSRGRPLDPTIAQALRAADVYMRDAPEHVSPCTLLVRHWDHASGAPVVVGFTRRRATYIRRAELYGFVVDRAAVTRRLNQLVQERPLLPPALTKGHAGNSALSIRVVDESNALLFESGVDGFADPTAFVARDRFDHGGGRLAYAIALRPSAAENLVIGGLPRSRLGLLVGLLALTTGLIVVALVQLRREYELARLRSDFVSGVSHELRTPLAQIRMFSETLLLRRVRSDDEARRSLEIIQQEARRLGHLVDNVLQFSKGQHRPTSVTLERRPIAPLLREVIDAFAPLARARRVSLHLSCAHDAIAPIDASALRQIVLNLLDNAVKYGPVGQTVTVTLALADTFARIVVDDEGPGIPAKEAAHIWAPFARLPQASAAGVAGAGIGLAVVRELTRLHGGRASVVASPARGARFIVDLPDATAAALVESWPTEPPVRSLTA